MPMKLLKPDGDSDAESDDKEEDNDGKDEAGSDNNEETEQHIIETTEKCEKVKKLVIRSDGNHFSSSFKRRSLDSIRSSMDSKMDVHMVDSDIMGAQTEDTADTADSVSGDSEDTNAYTNDDEENADLMQDEAEQAALAISEDSQDSQTEEEDISNQMASRFASSGPAYSRLADPVPEESNSQNYELAGDSVYFGTQEPMDISGSTAEKLRATEGSDNPDVVYIPSQSPVSTDSADILHRNTDIMDKFNLYQPITENLSDSEENSFCPSSVSGRVATGGKVLDTGKTGWTSATNAQVISDSSDQESDQEVKAQMESAINSILSLSQAGPEDQADSVYSFNQSEQYYSNPSQSESPYGDPGSMDRMLEESPMASQGEPDEDDLDLAVNSILM